VEALRKWNSEKEREVHKLKYTAQTIIVGTQTDTVEINGQVVEILDKYRLNIDPLEFSLVVLVESSEL
jgi:hypothetical protein